MEDGGMKSRDQGSVVSKEKPGIEDKGRDQGSAKRNQKSKKRAGEGSGKRHECAELSRFGSLAESNGPGGCVLRDNQRVPEK